MFGRIFIVLLLLLVLALAIMFDWFGTRGLLESGLNKTQKTVESLSKTGDRLQDTFESKN